MAPKLVTDAHGVNLDSRNIATTHRVGLRFEE